MGSREGIEVIKVEVLEQRILLAADLSVAGSDHLLQTQAAETAPAAPTSSQSTQTPSAWSAPVLSDPLQLHSPAGSVLDLHAAPAGQALSLPEGHTLTGSGLWAGPLINSGVVAPGESPGVLSVQSFEQASGATLKVEIGGTNAGAGQSNPLDGHDQVAVSGQARLAGILSLDFINDFRPSAGQVFDVMTWNSRQGSFSSYTGLYAGQGIYLKPIYQADRLRLVATALPGLDQLSVPDLPQAEQALDQWLSQLANQVSQSAVTLDASLDVGGVRLSGQWRLAVTPLANNQVETTWSAIDVGAQWTLPGLSGSLTGVNGTLVMGADALQLNLSGQGALTVGDGPSISGRLSLAWQQAGRQLSVTANDLNLQLGDPARGPALGLSAGILALTSGGGQYNLQISGTGQVQALAGVALQGQLRYLASSSSGARKPLRKRFTHVMAYGCAPPPPPPPPPPAPLSDSGASAETAAFTASPSAEGASPSAHGTSYICASRAKYAPVPSYVSRAET